MTREKLIELLGGLKAGTEQGKLVWQDLPDEEMFRTHVGNGLVRIGRVAEGRRGYTLWVMSNTGAIAAELDIHDDETGYALIEEVYNLAKFASRGGNSLLDSMIRQLPQPLPF